MRKLAAVTLASAMAIVAIAAPSPRIATASAAAPPVNPKVVLIVGPVGSSTSHYRDDAQAAAAEARKYTTNVITIYSPTATWTKAKSALQGASIVVYMGHGNGWPSPYAPFQTYTKDGLGLNPTSGTDNTTTKYWGEYYLASDIDLAPNAVVILGHLCYSAGNSEPGDPDPTLSVAKQRVDNMAAGWIKAGARAVVAEPYASGLWGGAAWYIRQLFTTHQSMDQIFQGSPNFNDNILTFPSVRSPGYTAEMDPGKPNAPPFRRSMVGKLTLQTVDVTGARYAATDRDPSTFVVPGAASVKVDGAGLFADPGLTPDSGTGLPPATLPLDTKVRLDGVYPVVGGSAVYAIHALDGSASGYMSAATLTPRDSQGPNIWTAEDGTGAFSPNGDGSQDVFDVSGQISESAAWRVDFTDGSGTVLHSVSGTGSTYDATWDGKPGGTAVADGAYAFTVYADDAWGNAEGSRSGGIVVDTVAPVLGAADVLAATTTFAPTGDGVGDRASLAYATNEGGFIDTVVTDGASQVVRTFATIATAGSGSVSWDGADDAGNTVPDGTYMVALAPRDEAGNVGGSQTHTVVVYTALTAVKANHTYFYPQDKDTLSKTSTFSFTLTKPATVTWTLANEAGVAIYTRFDARALAAGTYAYTWGGKTPLGAFVPRGRYTLTVSATDGTSTWSQRVSVHAEAFRIIPSTIAPTLGQTFTVKAVTAETLSGSVTLRVSQPGHTSWAITMTKVSSTTWQATVHLYSTGTPGSVKLSVSGHDTLGGYNSASLLVPVQ